SSAFRRLCKSEFLNFLRVREWMDLVRQLSRTANVKQRSHAKRASSTHSDAGTGPLAELVHRSVLAGLLSHLGIKDTRQDRRVPGGLAARGTSGSVRRNPAQEYLGGRGTRFVLHRGSALAKHLPEVVMAVELVETSRLFARNSAAIEPEWAEELAGPLAKRQL